MRLLKKCRALTAAGAMPRHPRVLAALAAALLVSSVAAAYAHDLPHPEDQQAARGLTVPNGFLHTPWMAVPAPTNLEWGPDKALYVTSMDGNIYKIPTPVKDLPSAPKVFATGLSQPLGLAIATNGTVFASESYETSDGETFGRIVAFGRDGSGPATVIEGLPNGRHNTNDMAIGPDGLLYITNGNSTDDGLECGPEIVKGQGEACAAGHKEEFPWSGSLLRINPAARNQPKESAAIVATGMRNVYDVAFRPGSRDAWVATNGPDSPAADDLLYRIPTTAPSRLHLGFPSCLYNAHENRGVGTVEDHHEHGHSLEPMNSLNPAVIRQFGACPTGTVRRPVATFGGHVSANGLAFAHGSGFGGTYGNDLFVAEWGNLWGLEDAHLSGHKIVRINLRHDGSIVQDHHEATPHEEGEEEHHAVSAVTEFATGGLPIDVAFGPDGAMFVADMGGMIHRIAWKAGFTPPDDEGTGDHHGGAAPHDDRYECPVNKQVEPATGTRVFEERYDYETGRKECVAFYTNPTDHESSYGSWDPATQDDDPNYSPGDRGQRWSMNEPGPERGGEGDDHYHDHNPNCSQAAQDELLARTRASLARYDGAEGVNRATRHGYVFYPIAWKIYHAFNTNLYDDVDPATGKQRDLVPEYPENIVYAMTDDGMKAMGAMFAIGWDEQRNRSWKDYQSVDELPKWTANTVVGADGLPEQCDMLWHSHTGEEGFATSFDPENPDESVPMAHVWAWGLDMWERGMDGTEANSWWAPYRLTPAICNQRDECL